MVFSILVLGAPFNSQSAYSAFRFVKAALESEHKIYRVFFYQDGIHNSSAIATPPQDEFNLYQGWQDLQAQHSLDFVTCIAAAARRGLLNENEAKRHNKDNSNMAKEFDLSGLGQLVEATALSDQVITFGQ